MDMDLDLVLVRSFLALAREGDQRRAASLLGISASGMSKRVRRLEEQVGAELTIRTASGLEITAAGRRFTPYALGLLRSAEHAREAVRALPDMYRLRVGVPAGGRDDLIDTAAMDEVAARMRQTFPDVRLSCVDVQFPMLRHCLVDDRVDVLWTMAPVEHGLVESIPLPWTSERIAVVPVGHRLAGAGVVGMDDFADEPLFFNPLVPEEWMRQFWLGDLRTRREARLVELDARVLGEVVTQTSDLSAALVTCEVHRRRMPPTAHVLGLRGVPPVVLHVARLRRDRRSTVLSFVAWLQAASGRAGRRSAQPTSA